MAPFSATPTPIPLHHAVATATPAPVRVITQLVTVHQPSALDAINTLLVSAAHDPLTRLLFLVPLALLLLDLLTGAAAALKARTFRMTEVSDCLLHDGNKYLALLIGYLALPLLNGGSYLAVAAGAKAALLLFIASQLGSIVENVGALTGNQFTTELVLTALFRRSTGEDVTPILPEHNPFLAMPVTTITPTTTPITPATLPVATATPYTAPLATAVPTETVMLPIVATPATATVSFGPADATVETP